VEPSIKMGLIDEILLSLVMEPLLSSVVILMAKSYVIALKMVLNIVIARESFLTLLPGGAGIVIIDTIVLVL